jgi:hypothetical protein
VAEDHGAPFVAEYDARREVLNPPPLRMVRELRNYASHRALPVIFSSLRHGRTRAPAATVYLGVDDLRRWTRWSATARPYVMSLDDDVQLSPLVAEYRQAVDDFYSWLGPMMRAWVQAKLQTGGWRAVLREWDA